jgi:hypothetical protein
VVYSTATNKGNFKPFAPGLHRARWIAEVAAIDVNHAVVSFVVPAVKPHARKIEGRPEPLFEAQCVDAETFGGFSALHALSRWAAHLAVGITNSAPFSMLSGQRCMIDFCLV